MSRIALIREPGPRLAEGIVTMTERQPVDTGLAVKQWRSYVDTLEANGWETLLVRAAPDCPDGVFVEDTMVVYRNVALVTRPGAVSRRAEVPAAASVVEGLGYTMRVVADPATLDGGDVLKVGDTIYVGRGGRTNALGVRAVRDAFEPFGATVVAVPVRSVLHLKSAVTALPDGTVVGYPPIVDHPSLFPRFLAVPEESGGHVVDLGDRRLRWQRTARRARHWSWTWVTSRSWSTSRSSRSSKGASPASRSDCATSRPERCDNRP